MTPVERVARAWHDGSDHAADGAPFGGPLCNCQRIAERVTPMLAEVFVAGFDYADGQHRAMNNLLGQRNLPIMLINPYGADQ